MSDTRPELVLVAALDRRRGIGLRGALPWSYPEDMKHFRANTLGHAMIAGRATQESIGKALPGRRTVVVTRAPEAAFPGCEVAPTLERAVALARETDDAPRVIGGGQLYAAALPLATELVLTEIDRDFDADVFFPDFSREGFVCVERTPGSTPELSFARYRRAGA